MFGFVFRWNTIWNTLRNCTPIGRAHDSADNRSHLRCLACFVSVLSGELSKAAGGDRQKSIQHSGHDSTFADLRRFISTGMPDAM